MIYAYEELKGAAKVVISKDDIKKMEEKVLVQLGFDFNFSSPRHFLDRYIRILDEHLPEEYKPWLFKFSFFNKFLRNCSTSVVLKLLHQQSY